MDGPKKSYFVTMAKSHIMKKNTIIFPSTNLDFNFFTVVVVHLLSRGEWLLVNFHRLNIC